jgi:hypothetical protein
MLEPWVPQDQGINPNCTRGAVQQSIENGFFPEAEGCDLLGFDRLKTFHFT